MAPSGTWSRALGQQRRRRVGVAAGVVAAAVLGAVGLQVVGDPDAAREPGRPAAATPTTGGAAGDAVGSIREITPDDVRDYEALATRTNTQPGNEDLTQLFFDVGLRDRYAPEWSSFCSGDPDTWYVLVVGRSGPSALGQCDQSVPERFPTFPADISPITRHGARLSQEWVRMFVTGPIPQRHLDCFRKKSPPDCKYLTPRLVPLASTDVTFGVSVYEYWAPSVATVAGFDVSARASAHGTDYVLSQVLTPGPDQHGLSAALPATDGDRIVAVLDSHTDALVECMRAAPSDVDSEQCRPVLELRIGDRTVPLERGESGDLDMLGAPHGFFRVPTGDQEVGVRVASGDPEHIDFALVVFEEGDVVPR